MKNQIELSFAELHTSLFLAGTNLGLKLQPTNRQIKLIYNCHRELLVFFNNHIAIVPLSNVASMTPKDMADLDEEAFVPEAPKPIKPGKPVKAQVSTPQDHVFAEGAGKK